MRHEMELAARRARDQLKKEQTKGVVTRKLGKVKYEEPNLELKLTNELPSSLRLLKVGYSAVNLLLFCGI
jgi:Nop53 (60S ribosomal biogenesis)